MRRVLLAAGLTAVFTACERHPTDTGPISVVTRGHEAGAPLGLGHGPPTPRVVDFETPNLGGGKEPVERFVDPSTGIAFTAVQEGPFDDWIVGIVPNSGTSACVPVDLDNQTMGTGRASHPGSLGFAGAAIRADFPRSLLRGSVVSLRFQALVGAEVRVTLLDRNGGEVATREASVVNAVGSCSGGHDRGIVTVSVEASERAATVVVEQLSNFVFVVDDFTIDAQRGPGT